jgi:hypothetical protein
VFDRTTSKRRFAPKAAESLGSSLAELSCCLTSSVTDCLTNDVTDSSYVGLRQERCGADSVETTLLANYFMSHMKTARPATRLAAEQSKDFETKDNAASAGALAPMVHAARER